MEHRSVTSNVGSRPWQRRVPLVTMRLPSVVGGSGQESKRYPMTEYQVYPTVAPVLPNNLATPIHESPDRVPGPSW